MLEDFLFRIFASPTACQLATVASTAGRLRTRNAIVFASLKKDTMPIFNSDIIGTEPKKAANPVIGLENLTVTTLNSLRYKYHTHFT